MPRATGPSAPADDTASDRVTRLRGSLRASLGALVPFVERRVADAARAAEGLWRRDPTVWTADPEVGRRISERLGWLDAPSTMASELTRVEAFAERIRADGITDVVLLGMGGSSLAPEVLRAVLGPAPGWPRLHVLDTTDPAAVRAVSTAPAHTLYLFASKSGTTIEPNALAAHFRASLESAGRTSWASHFAAITDDGTPLAVRARAEGFRETFVNPSDIGGRYSALSLFGLVPAALLGRDIRALLDWGSAMIEAARLDGDVLTNPAVALGLVIGAAARTGRDKLTFLTSPDLEPFGLWIEQLVAESTGKQGVGVVPVTGEVPDERHEDRDRLYVKLRSGQHGGADAPLAGGTQAPVIVIDLPEPLALGAEFVRWEIATAVAGALLRINPFDEPNVQQAKKATEGLLGEFKRQGHLPLAAPDGPAVDGARLTLTTAAGTRLGDGPPERILTLLGPGDYLGLLAYVDPAGELARALQAFRQAVHTRTGVATTIGIGPRYLHSTGQLHKGGAGNGVFVLLTATPETDLTIPGESYSFGTLELAQALGDFESLSAAGRRGLHVHLPAPDPGILARILDRLLSPVARV